MSVPRNFPRCGVCGSKLVKNGRTSAGKTRWRCRVCGASITRQRADISKRADVAGFVGWLLGKAAQREVARSDRSFRRHVAWCWNIAVPQPAVTGQVHRQIIVDGTYFGSWCVLIAHDGTHVIGWQWCASESKTAWGELLRRFPAPDVIVTDGGSGLRAALDRHWPKTRIQRCYFHIRTTITRHTTLNPRLEAGKEILALTKELMDVHDLDAAAAWMSRYAAWESRWDQFLKERTHAKTGTDRPKWVSASASWWFTHKRLRQARGLIRTLIRDQALFTWLEGPYRDQNGTPTVERTTSRLEGGPNAAIKRLLRTHRGLPDHHARTAVDWFLNSKTEHPYDPWDLAKDHLKNQSEVSTPPPADNPIGPAGYDTGLTAEEGLWTRKGWAGRS